MSKNNFTSILANTGLVVWSIVCLAVFMYFPGAISHMQGASLYDFPTLPEKLARIHLTAFLSDTLTAFIGMLFFGVSCVSLGMKLISMLHLDNLIKDDTRSPKGILLPTYFLIGNAGFSFIFLTLAALSQLTRPYSIIILSLGLLSGITHFRKLPIPAIHFSTGYEKIVAILSLAILIASLFQSSARISYDASAVYFSDAKLTAFEHHIGYFLENTFLISVFHSVIQFTAVMQIFGDQSARMISWLFGIANILLAVELAKLVGVSALTRRILPVLILTSTAFLDQMGDGKVELFSSAYSLAAVYWLVLKNPPSRQSQPLYFLSGIFIGFACILRPYNVFLLGIFVFIYVAQQIKAGMFSIRQAAQHLAWMALGAIGFAIYHLFMNEAILGSPFAFWTSLTKINPTDGPWDFKPETIWIYRLLYPFVVSFKNNGATLGNITPFVLVFLPILVVKKIREHIVIPKDVAQVAAAAGIALFSWIILSFAIVEVRYVLFLWFILFILIAEIIAKTSEVGNPPLRITAAMSTILLMSFILIRSMYISIATYSPLDAQGNPQCTNTAICGHIAPINETAAPDERVLMLSAYRYYLRADLLICSSKNDEYTKLQDLSTRSPDEFWLEVYRQGYKYIAYENDYAVHHLGFKNFPGPDSTPKWIELVPLYKSIDGLQAAYKIIITDPSLTLNNGCIAH